MAKETGSCAAAERAAEYKLDQQTNDGNRITWDELRILQFSMIIAINRWILRVRQMPSANLV